MSYRDNNSISPTGTRPVGKHGSTDGSGWGLVIVLVVLLAILTLGSFSSPSPNLSSMQTGASTTQAAVIDQAGPAATSGMTPAAD